jgi:secreted PhoX family phosphatase
VYNAGCTRVVVDEDRSAVETVHVLGGTSANCAGGETPWGSWLTCEEAYIPAGLDGSTTRTHGYCFEIDASSDEPRKAMPIRAAGAFSHEAVAFLDGILYETEDRRNNAGFYRYIADPRPWAFGDLASSDDVLQTVRRVGRPNFDADTATVGESFAVDWVTIDDPDPQPNPGQRFPRAVRVEAQSKGAMAFDRLEVAGTATGRSTSTPPLAAPRTSGSSGSTSPHRSA